MMSGKSPPSPPYDHQEAVQSVLMVEPVGVNGQGLGVTQTYLVSGKG